MKQQIASVGNLITFGFKASFAQKCGVFVSAALIGMFANVAPSMAEWIESGNQVIDGTQVHTTVYHERGYATFSNSCGSQSLTQSQLQAGAKPTNIIPCPRRSSSYNSRPAYNAPSYGGKRVWAAVAAGISDGILGIGGKVSVGLAKNYGTRSEAERRAVNECEKNGISCSVVTAWNSGCYYITTSDHAENLAWGSGPTAQDAYNECYRRVQGGNCKTHTLGTCYPR